MDQSYLLALAVATIVALAAIGAMRARAPAATRAGGVSTFAVSTEGMKICPKCGMGNLWTERRCSACGNGLKG